MHVYRHILLAECMEYALITLLWSQQRVCGPRILPVNEEHVRFCSRPLACKLYRNFEGVDVFFALNFSSLQVFGDPKSELIQNYVVSCFLLSDDQFATKEDRKSCKQRATVVKELLLM